MEISTKATSVPVRRRRMDWRWKWRNGGGGIEALDLVWGLGKEDEKGGRGGFGAAYFRPLAAKYGISKSTRDPVLGPSFL